MWMCTLEDMMQAIAPPLFPPNPDAKAALDKGWGLGAFIEKLAPEAGFVHGIF